jgi:Outer membrane protein beta-barrel domain
MHSKNILMTLFLLSLTAFLSAQTSVGLEGGLSDNSYHTNIANRAATQLASKAGFSMVASLRYRVCAWLYGIAAPGLVQKGYSMNRTDSLSGEYDQHTNLYLQLPIGIGLVHEWGRFRVGLDLGVYAGYWLSGRVKGNTAEIFGNAGANNSEQFQLTGYNASYSFNAQRDKRWEEGWWTGPALQYRLTDTWGLTAGARYYGALTSQEKAPVSSIPAYNRTWIFSVGAAWSLSHAKSRR